jgi:hypothetical protein
MTTFWSAAVFSRFLDGRHSEGRAEYDRASLPKRQSTAALQNASEILRSNFSE